MTGAWASIAVRCCSCVPERISFEGKAEKRSCCWPLRRYRLGRSRKIRYLTLVTLQFVL